MDHLYFVAHTHWDREWYQPFQRMRARLLAMTDRMLGLLEDGSLPCFHFDGQTIVLEDYLEVRPDAARRIAKLVKAGKLQIGPWYLLADSFIPSGEALIRNLEIGRRLAHRFGTPTAIGYLPDQFGHAAQLPQILSGFGLKAAVTFRGVGREIKRNRFIWEGLDGNGLLTIFLPFGYANGASFPSDSAAALLARAQEIARREREFADGSPILVMNGNDHAEPDPRVFALLGEASHLDSVAMEAGTLEEYVRRVAELPQDGLAHHRGELRSPARSNVTPGVTSARAWIKQRDFHNAYLLERIADPLAALAGILGRGDNLNALLELAWRTAIQNHPHDSICGCSIDQVHRDMRYRFDQAEMIADNAVRSAISTIFRGQRSGEPAIAVFNPTFSRRAVVNGETELEDPDANYVVVDGDGQRVPAIIELSRRARGLDIELSAADFRGLTTGSANIQVMGLYLQRFALRAAGANRFELDLLLSRNAPAAFDSQDFRKQLTALPDDARVLIHGKTAARAKVCFVANGLAQAGFTFYRVVRDDSANLTLETPTNTQSIENEFFRVGSSATGLSIDDLSNGKHLELHFEDDGDRGDEYNFDPVSGSAPILMPQSLSVRAIERGPVRSRLGLSIIYRLPASLTPDRAARAEQTVDLTVNVTAAIYAGLARIDFDAAVDNPARDHRLRAALSTPVAAVESISDTNFGVVRRPLDPVEPAGITEDVYPTAPHRIFTAVESPDLSAAVLSRGIYETEVKRDTGGATILLTLLRCIGWLSRGDLKMRRGDAGPEMETPDAQEIGSHRFEFAVTTWRGSYSDSDFLERTQAYAFPPRAFAARAGFDSLQLCECDNPRILFSTARGTERADGHIVRVFSASEVPERARFKFGAGRGVRLIDLAGHPVKQASFRRRRDGTIELELRPFQIVTFKVARAAAA
ncbi:MAG: glycoside hydrolase family 38 C-terminal domain-containing protein [Candidatus Binataceae bacterium]